MARFSKADLIDALALHNDLETKAEAGRILEFITETITAQVAEGNDVNIAGFGKFYKFTSSTTGKVKPKFNAAKAFKDAVTA